MKILRADFDNISVKPQSAIIRKIVGDQEIIEVRYDPAKPLKEGFHLLFIVAGSKQSKKFSSILIKVDKGYDSKRITTREEMSNIFNHLSEKRSKVRTLDAKFTLNIKAEREDSKLARDFQGKVMFTGWDNFDFTLACEPKTKISGRKLIWPDWEKDFSRNERDKRELLKHTPVNPVYYTPYDDLMEYYSWNIYKEKNGKLFIWGGYKEHKLPLPTLVELVIDKNNWLLDEINTYIRGGGIVSTKTLLEYDEKGIPIKQSMERCLIDGTREKSVFSFTGIEINKRQLPRKTLFEI